MARPRGTGIRGSGGGPGVRGRGAEAHRRAAGRVGPTAAGAARGLPFPRNSPGSAGAARRLLLTAAAGLGGLGGGRPAQVAPQVLGLGQPLRRHHAARPEGTASAEGRAARGAGPGRGRAGRGAGPGGAGGCRDHDTAPSRNTFYLGVAVPRAAQRGPPRPDTAAVRLRGRPRRPSALPRGWSGFPRAGTQPGNGRGAPAPNKSWSPEQSGEEGEGVRLHPATGPRLPLTRSPLSSCRSVPGLRSAQTYVRSAPLSAPGPLPGRTHSVGRDGGLLHTPLLSLRHQHRL